MNLRCTRETAGYFTAAFTTVATLSMVAAIVFNLWPLFISSGLFLLSACFSATIMLMHAQMDAAIADNYQINNVTLPPDYSSCYVVSQENNNQRMCPVCLDTACDELKRVVLPCNHAFHEVCILEWFKRKRLCPGCKRDPMPDIHPV